MAPSLCTVRGIFTTEHTHVTSPTYVLLRFPSSHWRPCPHESLHCLGLYLHCLDSPACFVCRWIESCNMNSSMYGLFQWSLHLCNSSMLFCAAVINLPSLLVVFPRVNIRQLLSILVLVEISIVPVFTYCQQHSLNIPVHIFGEHVHISIGYISQKTLSLSNYNFEAVSWQKSPLAFPFHIFFFFIYYNSYHHSQLY